MRILGIDPGLRITGFGVIDVDGPRLEYVASGVVRTPDGVLPARLHAIFGGVREIVATHRPHCAAIEQVFVNVNPHSTLLLGQARGAAICGLVAAGLDIHEYTALQTKQATVGHGKAKKAQVQEMVTRLLRLSGIPSTDAADALACAICHAHVGASVAALARSNAPSSPTSAPRRIRLRRGRLSGLA